MSVFADFDAVKEGDQQSLVKQITEADIRRFVELTGDDNPLHVDADYAAETSFKEIVVHGMLGASFISTVIGTKLPGRAPCGCRRPWTSTCRCAWATRSPSPARC
jgi:3-oxoacyl-[acyl-carrier protein] reductase